ncbi:MAG TPA: Holliday junction branch migration protein RuvA [Pyrinomonadaceae bacterium]|nr:Holliday junction branch migration protein RuvA [Pyrinomonadaceae bacterium]
MIAHLSGKLHSKHPNSVIVDVSGVGYEVNIPLSTYYDLADTGSNVQLRIYMHVKEDALQLYGFKTARERELFINFISVSGIGPRLGIALLSNMNADELIHSIKTNNLGRLTSIPGIGRKTAERLVVDLREKMTQLSLDQVVETPAEPETAGATGEDSVRAEALSGLLNLGYQRSAAEKAVESALSEGGDVSVESVLKRSLKKMGSRLIG